MGAPAKGHELLDELLGVQRQKSLWIPGHYHPIAERYRASNQRHRTVRFLSERVRRDVPIPDLSHIDLGLALAIPYGTIPPH
jgi:hypothetical protein